jgi:N-methylhydantoinase B
MRMIDVIFCAMAKAAPDRVVANAYGTINALSLAGHRKDGRRWVMFSFYGGGHGGTPEGDGLNHANAPISTATIPPVEILESAYPVMFRQWALRPDSAGGGAHRGGLGAIYEIELLEEEADVFLFGERGRYAPKGVVGGGEAALSRFQYQQDGVWTEPEMTSKAVGIRLHRGERVRLETPGGGGYGAAADRAPSAIERDVALGYVSSEESDRLYGQDLQEQSK